ncbi:MAG: acyl-CoA dehydrogenase family protein, partial [Dehalococcoidia bacterium]
MNSTSTGSQPYLDTVERIAVEVVAPMAVDVDRDGAFPRAALDALSAAGLLGLVSARETGGIGHGHRAAAVVVERLARECAST